MVACAQSKKSPIESHFSWCRIANGQSVCTQSKWHNLRYTSMFKINDRRASLRIPHWPLPVKKHPIIYDHWWSIYCYWIFTEKCIAAFLPQIIRQAPIKLRIDQWWSSEAYGFRLVLSLSLSAEFDEFKFWSSNRHGHTLWGHLRRPSIIIKHWTQEERRSIKNRLLLITFQTQHIQKAHG